MQGFQVGYASTPGEALHPGLQHGLIAAWAPILGPTGRELRDIRRGRHLEFPAGMDAGTDWVVHRGLHQLQLDGVDDYLTSGTVNHGIGTGDFTWAVLVEPTGHPNGYSGICANGGFAPALYTQLGGSTSWGMWFGGAKTSGTGSNLAINQQHAIVARRKSGTVAFWQNGAKTPTEHTVTTSMADAAFKIGTSSAGANEMAGYIGYVYWYRRALLESEIATLYADPFAPVRKKQRKRFFVAGGGGGGPVEKKKHLLLLGAG